MVKITIKHYFDFKENNKTIGKRLDNFQSWDTLRINGKSNDAFSIPESRLLWEKKCLDNPVFDQQAADIKKIVDQGGYRRINSYGAGAAHLEYLIKKKAPHIFLECSDYAPKTIERLKEFFKEADKIIQFDILKDEWVNEGPACLYLFHRVDTEFDDREWRAIFERAGSAGIQYILFVPSEFLTLRRFIRQKTKLLLYKLLRKRITFAGYFRTREQSKAFFYKNYEIERVCRIGDLQGFLLKHIN